jgi:nucleoside-diphosphate-sugar epimerase
MHYSGRNVIVTGADRFIGSHLADALVRADANATALARYSCMDSHDWLDSLESEMRGAMRPVRVDVRDPGFVMRLLQGQDICTHIATLIAIPDIPGDVHGIGI